MNLEQTHHSEFDAILMECLDAVADGRLTVSECLVRYPAHAKHLAGVLSLASDLSQIKAVRPSLGYRKQAANRLQRRIAQSTRPPRAKRMVPRVSSAPAFSLQRLALRSAIALLVVVLLTSFTGAAVYAADCAVPGDSLYPLDTAVESVQLKLASSPSTVVTLNLAFADERLQEAEVLFAAGNEYQANVALTLYDETISNVVLAAESVDEADKAVVDTAVQENVSKHVARLEALLDKVPEQAHPGIQRAIEASNNRRQNAPGQQNRGTDNPGQDDGDQPGRSEDAPGQNKDKDKTDPESESENSSEAQTTPAASQNNSGNNPGQGNGNSNRGGNSNSGNGSESDKNDRNHGEGNGRPADKDSPGGGNSGNQGTGSSGATK